MAGLTAFSVRPAGQEALCVRPAAGTLSVRSARQRRQVLVLIFQRRLQKSLEQGMGPVGPGF